jgi:hypothetical protein
MEVVVAVGVLAVAMVLVAQIGVYSLGQRGRDAARHEALELAANVMEAARACPWEDLTPEWASTHKLPETLSKRLYQGKLTVRVEPEANRPQSKRVTVEIHWKLKDDISARPVQLVGLFSARSAAASGGKP